MGQLNNLDWEHVDIAAFLAGIKGNGVISGLEVSESTTPGMTVLVSSGSCDVDDVRYTESSGQNLNISNGNATHSRKDIVVYDTSAGNPAVVEGTPAAAPIPPDVPSGDIYLALIHVAANETTSIVNADIDEGRVFVQDHHHTTHEFGGTDVLSYYDPNIGSGIVLDDTASGDHSRTGNAPYAVLTPAIDKVMNIPAGVTLDLGITFTQEEVSNSGTSYARIYRNGVAVGAERSANHGASPKTSSEIISGWVNGDHLQIYGYHNVGGTMKVYAMKIYGSTTLPSDPTWT